MDDEETACWFVGATYGTGNDQLPRFLADGIWENAYQDKYKEHVRSMKPGDRIAIKATYTRKKSLPFENFGRLVSVMAIKGVGVITENLGDGRTVRVDWKTLEKPREWYFATGRKTMWKVKPDSWMHKALVDFTFEGLPQPIDRFLNEPYWKAIYGPKGDRFEWVEFYEALADRLLDFRYDRASLLNGIYEHVDGTGYLKDKFLDGTSGRLRDICPFTVFGVFNRGLTDANRKRRAEQLKDFLGLGVPVPEHFHGIPVLFNTMSMFFFFEVDRQPGDIDLLWDAFASAIKLADSDSPETRDEFLIAYDKARLAKGVAWNLTMGCYWIRPWAFPTLDANTRSYLSKTTQLQMPSNPPKAEAYLALAEELTSLFQDPSFPVHSFPELSKAAWTGAPTPSPDPEDDASADAPGAVVSSAPYTVADIVADGCFMPMQELEQCLTKLKSKKNLILQGPPGTGKTWLARKLAFALVGLRDSDRVRALQFHPNLSYEDFVRGWRPGSDGKLELCDGPFMEAVAAANALPDLPLVLVIEEINRGHPAQILGEMLTLLDADKRGPTDALELCYRRFEGERIHLPKNLFLIGTMNIADRSLAIVDFALRRRFAFVDLGPRIGSAWRTWIVEKNGVSEEIAHKIESRMNELNETIRSDSTLGPAFRIGHSYVTPSPNETITDPESWFLQVVESEIGPLLDEYWFDSLDKSSKAQTRLRLGF